MMMIPQLKKVQRRQKQAKVVELWLKILFQDNLAPVYQI